MDKKIIAIVAAVLVIVLGVWLFMANGGSEDENGQADDETAAPTSNIVELAQASSDLSTLVAAVVEADLVGTLSGPGPFTVFAPTNAAFAALLDELDITADELLAREDLASILTYHVLPAEVLSTALSDGQTATTVQGGEITVSIDGGVVKINDATVVTADVQATNGVVHIIDTVLLP